MPAVTVPSDVLRVAVLGAGTVGREVVRAFLETPDRMAVAGGPRMILAGVAVRDLSRAVARGIPDDLLTDAPAHLVASPETDVVVELLGGDEPARTLVMAALDGGKGVVTANKHVVAHHGPALEAAARRSGAPLRFEAAVGGGIPVLRPLAGDLASNCIERIRGIVNGTTNYILSAMARDGRGYADVLADAQAAGYAEADPTADVEGIDAANKLAILARLGFGTWLDADAVERRPPSLRGFGRPGITGVGALDVAAARALGLALKLVADASAAPGGAVRASVVPTALPLEDPLGRTDGVTNRIEVRAVPLGTVAFSGPGAGGAATASAVRGDLRAIAQGEGSTWAGLPDADRSIEPLGPDSGGGRRAWFFVLPEGAAADADLRAHGVVARGSVPGGTAVHVPNLTLDALRARLRSVVPGDLDLTLYPAEPLDAG
jgi:homoserine dehydrogenase